MKHDCGIINPNARTRLISRTQTEACLPPETREELHILMTTPGFTTHYLAHALNVTPKWLHNAKSRFNPEDYQERALENWNSITRDDALALAAIRPKGFWLPVICQVYIADDMANKVPWRTIQKTWKVSEIILRRIHWFGPFQGSRNWLPDWFNQKVI